MAQSELPNISGLDRSGAIAVDVKYLRTVRRRFPVRSEVIHLDTRVNAKMLARTDSYSLT